jgi:hypothetical protein
MRVNDNNNSELAQNTTKLGQGVLQVPRFEVLFQVALWIGLGKPGSPDRLIATASAAMKSPQAHVPRALLRIIAIITFGGMAPLHSNLISWHPTGMFTASRRHVYGVPDIAAYHDLINNQLQVAVRSLA